VPDAIIQRITEALTALTREGGTRNRVAVMGDVGHVVFSSERGAASIKVQVSAGRQLPKGVTIEPADYARLHELGLRQARASEDMRLEFTDSDEDRRLWARHSLTILQRTFGTPTLDNIKVRARYEEVDQLDNSALFQAMNHLAKSRSWSARTGVYMQLIRARVVWALDAPSFPDSPLPSAKPHIAGDLGGHPSMAIFSDYDALDHYDPTGLDARVETGQALFPLFAARRVGSVLINPGGSPRGELYGNEVLSVVDGIKRMTGMH